MSSDKRIAAFYENIRTGAVHDSVSMVDAVSGLRKSGLLGIYVSYDSTVQYADELAEVLEKTGAEITGLHAWVNFDKTDAHEVIDQAVRLGTDHVLLVPVCAGNDTETLIAGMRNAVAYGEKNGVRIYMEDLDQADSPYNSAAGLQFFLDQVPGLRCCFDTGNLIMHREDEVQAFRHLQSRICALHLKDRAMTPANADDVGKKILDGSNRYPVPVGKGYIQIPEILAIAGDLPMIVELYDYSPSHMLEGIRSSIQQIMAWDNKSATNYSAALS